MNKGTSHVHQGKIPLSISLFSTIAKIANGCVIKSLWFPKVGQNYFANRNSRENAFIIETPIFVKSIEVYEISYHLRAYRLHLL